MIINNMDQLENMYGKMEKQNQIGNMSHGTLLEMNLSKSILFDIRNVRFLPYKISGQNRILIVFEREDFASNTIDWASINTSWKWVMLDAGKCKVVIRFYEDCKEKELFFRRIDRKFFKRSVLESLWVYLKGSSPLWECELKWMQN